MHELPLNPKVKSGVLPNGLHYYVLHNEEPKERANFYIAQKVGSTLETQEQLGLAHFPGAYGIQRDYQLSRKEYAQLSPEQRHPLRC